MRVTKKRGAIAVVAAVTVAAAVAIPTVLAGSRASQPASVTTPASPGTKAISSGSCNGFKMKYAIDDTNGTSYTTTSTSFVPVPGMSVDFNPNTACAEITFSSPASAGVDGEVMMVRALVNGTPCLGPSIGQQFAGITFGTYLEARSLTFVCAGWHVGYHNVATVEYRSFFGNIVGGNAQTMVVRYG